MKLLKNYSTFIKESVDDLAKSIADLAENDDFAKSLIVQHINSDTTVSLENALRFLSEEKLKFIKDQILKGRRNITEESAEIIANTILENVDIEIGGKNLFKCFLKIITALGQKNISQTYDWDRENFIVYFQTELVDHEEIKTVFSRFEFFEENFEKLNLLSNAALYFGVKDGLLFEYGIFTDGQNIAFGNFTITNGVYNSLLKLESQSASNFKLFLNNFNFKNLKMIDEIKSSMLTFNPGYFEKKNFSVVGNIFKFGYYAVGKWDNGKMDEGEIENIKVNFKNFLMSNKWSDYIQIKVSPENFWLYFKFKFK